VRLILDRVREDYRDYLLVRFFTWVAARFRLRME